ncbi:MAG TPA: uroporphyrinogen-III synthase, partial [Dehalococcoidia bacterium]|nr:uroporphyrinogen-III synthase [Dehalococcoidia bacterium]
TAAALRARGLRADLVAGEFTSAGLLEALPLDVGGLRFLLPRAEGGSEDLTGGLKARGALVDEIVLYRSGVPASADPEALKLVRSGRIDAVTFASSSSVRNLAALLGEDFSRLRSSTVACIGPLTAATARELGLEVAVEPATHTVPALVEALVRHYEGARA